MRKLLSLMVLGLGGVLPAVALADIPQSLLCPWPDNGSNCQTTWGRLRDTRSGMEVTDLNEMKKIPDPNKQLICDPQNEGTWAADCDAACKPSVWKNCFLDDVFIFDGDEMVNGKPAVSCDAVMGSATQRTCELPPSQVHAIAQAVFDKMKAADAGWANGLKWDQVVIFEADFGRLPNPSGPMFFRDGKANEVAGIGLDVNKRTKPWIGVIDGGNTKDVGNPTSKPAVCGKSQRKATDPLGDQPNYAICAPDFYSYYDALAQATANLFAPYIELGPDIVKSKDMMMSGMGMGMSKYKDGLSVQPSVKSGFYPDMSIHPELWDPKKMPPMPPDAPDWIGKDYNPRIWNSLLDLDGSVLGGNNYRNNGNGTWEASDPPNDLLGTTDGTDLLRSPQKRLVFHPMDLYLMGLISYSDATKVASPTGQTDRLVDTFLNATAGDVVRPTGVKMLDWQIGPGMGMRKNLVFRDSARTSVKVADLLGADKRDPSYDKAPHVLKQLWVVIRKPKAEIAMNIKKPDDAAGQFNTQFSAFNNVARWRREFERQFYRLTGWRGRITTSVEGVEDLPYWEFGDPDDDKTYFRTMGGIEVDYPGPETLPGSIQSVLRLKTTGADGALQLGRDMRLDMDQVRVRAPFNAITLRVRLPAGAPSNMFARLDFDNGTSIRIPARATIINSKKDKESYLISDGRWHNYSASLLPAQSDKISKDQARQMYYASLVALTGETDPKTKKQLSPGVVSKGFTFYPSSKPVDGMEIEFLRFGSLTKPNDNDKNCAGQPQPDGFVDDEDNCPTIYNPDQLDGNNDGIGDACEDYDSDSIINACDNCPFLTNSQQRDGNKNGKGDICDGDIDTGCFLYPNSIAGPVASSKTGLAGLALMVGSLGAAFAVRRARRRRK